jgi:pimeloyl-ACP methyl ester carboxylesterase
VARKLLRVLLALLALLLLLLIGLRVAAALREGEAAPPPQTSLVSTPYGKVAVALSGPPAGRRVMLVHGTAAWSGFWKDVAAHLAERGYRVIAVDLPPFGWSDHDPQARYDRVTQAARLAAVLQSAGGDGAILVGHSFGAGPATELALRHKDRVGALILVDAALGELDRGQDSGTASAMRVRPIAEITTSASVTNPAAIGPLLRSMIARKEQAGAWLEVLRQPMRREGTTSAYAAWLPHLFEWRAGELSRTREGLKSIAVPVAVVWGEADTVTPIDQGRNIATLTRARSIRTLPGVGHIPHIEDPAAFLAALDASIASVEVPVENDGGRN